MIIIVIISFYGLAMGELTYYYYFLNIIIIISVRWVELILDIFHAQSTAKV